MKILSIIFLFASISLFAQPPFQCKNGETLQTTFITLPVTLSPNCTSGDIMIYYCCSTNPTTGRLTIDIVGASIVDWRCFAGTDFSSPAFVNELRTELIKAIIDENDPSSPCYIDPQSISSCLNPTYFVDVEDSGCIQIAHVYEDQATYLIPCGNGRCENTYKVCYDYTQNPVAIEVTRVNTDQTEIFCSVGDLKPYDGQFDGQLEVISGGLLIPYDYISNCTFICH